MTRPIIWSEQARTQIYELHGHIAESQPAAADQQLELILSMVERLSEFPELGRKGRLRWTRELVIPGTPFVVAYRVQKTRIDVLAVVHGARRWPRSFGE